MIRKLFILAICFSVLACSNDDNNGPDGPQELQIEKYTSISIDANGTPTGSKTEYYFDENGTLSQKKTVDATFNDTRIIDYNYNALGQLNESIETFLDVNAYRTLSYIYDATNKLDYITESYDGATPDIYFELTQEPNKIKIIHASPGFYTTLNYNNNILTSIYQEGDGGAHSTENLIYNGANNITERPKVVSSAIFGEPDTYENKNYQYDDKINPLYQTFNEQTLNLLGQYWFNIDRWKQFFSPNNFTNEVYTNTQNPDNNYTISRTIQYNEAGYPISAIVKKGDVIIEEQTYEYY